jgi:hypothetical protein
MAESEAHRLFQNNPGKHSGLKIFWPELYDALAGLGPGQQNRTITCVVGSCPMTDPRPLAVARLSRMGHPACRSHVAKLADRPGGWPLRASENFPPKGRQP